MMKKIALYKPTEWQCLSCNAFFSSEEDVKEHSCEDYT